MTDLLQVLPDLDSKPYSHLLPSLDRALITTNDLLTLDAADVAKRAQLPARLRWRGTA
jgi:DNA repair protein RAD57